MADRIVMLDGGKIIEQGPYDQLMAKNGAFADLVRRQQLESV
jgi:ABC-type multidrug transport system fused ATPase/permease subunit